MRYLRVYEWTSQKNHRRYAGISPMVVVHLLYDDSENQAQMAVEELAKRRQGERVLMPFWLLTRQLRKHIPELPEREDLDYLTIFEHGVEVASTIEWFRPLGERLRERGMWLDLIAADVEDGVTTWDILGAWDPEVWEERLGRIYDSPLAFARLPQDLKRLRPTDYSPWTDTGRDAVNRFNHYARSLVVDAITEIFVRSRVLDDARGRKRFKVSNWNDLRPTFPLADHNGWPAPGLATDSVSSWAAYLGSAGGMYKNREHEMLWNAFVHNVNYARSCVAARGGSVIPWISSPRWFTREQPDGTVEQGYDMGQVWMWRELMAHLVRTGVREFLLWNADPDPGLARKMVAETMRANDKPYSRRRLEEVPFDVDRVTTRGYTTTYTDFLKASK